MKIKTAPNTGFCFGVKRAIGIAEEVLKNSEYKKNTIYSLGAVIHNPQVVNSLSQKGLKVIKNINGIKKGTVLVSSHGAPKDIIEKIRKKKLKLIDATCPFVKYAQDIVRDLRKDSYRIIIKGDKKHPEVKALLSLAGNRRGKKIAVISQTTQSKKDYLESVSDILKEEKDFSEIRVFNTICNDTSNRQLQTFNLLKKCDVMVVIGGRNSANTKRLYQICKESGVNTYHIEVESELKKKFFLEKKCVGIISGASTPHSVVKKVVEKIKNLKKEGC